MELTLTEIRQGTFSKEWGREYAGGYSRLKKLLGQQEKMDLWELEKQAIEMLRGF